MIRLHIKRPLTVYQYGDLSVSRIVPPGEYALRRIHHPDYPAIVTYWLVMDIPGTGAEQWGMSERTFQDLARQVGGGEIEYINPDVCPQQFPSDTYNIQTPRPTMLALIRALETYVQLGLRNLQGVGREYAKMHNLDERSATTAFAILRKHLHPDGHAPLEVGDPAAPHHLLVVCELLWVARQQIAGEEPGPVGEPNPWAGEPPRLTDVPLPVITDGD